MAPLTPTQSVCSLDSFFDPFADDDSEFFLLSLQQKRKRVRINPNAIVLDYVEHVSELSADDRRRGWWSKDEYEATKRAAKYECRELRRKGILKGCLTDAYDKACHAAQNAVTGCDDLTPSASLLKWCVHNESSRGLERWSSKTHGFLRGKHVGRAKQAVLLEQAKQYLLNERNADLIASISSDASRRCSAFARLLGAADAIVVFGDRKRSMVEALALKPSKIPKISIRSSPAELFEPSDDESNEDPKSPTYVAFDTLSSLGTI